MKKYEIALMFGGYEYDDIDIIEYDTIEQVEKHLKELFKDENKDLYKIEVSIQEQNEDGENIDTYTFMEIDVKSFYERVD